ncbi:polcalcin Syr v 3-like [Herrania umbratica]|uniref:Polcalcin Syr v 3-like n=1 Tax=Herrania umbratica TaxID=108875 RepID=A0A6J1BJ78_9ROSI|nr:polcalcin Syr v 3-like [Herrania umbratica]
MVLLGPEDCTCNKDVDHRLVRKNNTVSPPFAQPRRRNFPPALTEAELISVFRRFDGDGDCRLSWQDLKNAFHSLGSWSPSYRALTALCHADKNRDGYISEDEMDDPIRYALSCGYCAR